MDSSEMRVRAEAARVARLATADEAGHPHIVPFCFAFLGESIVWAVDAKPKTTSALRRLSNIAVNPAVSLVIDQYDDADWSKLWWIRIDGLATVVTDETRRNDALDALAAKYPQYIADRPRGPVTEIIPTQWRSWP